MSIETTLLSALTLLFGFYMSWNIGANDVSNAMGTSVGSKALTLKKAVILAAILEFLGAFLIGSHVSSTIQQGIINPDIFHLSPMVFVVGMISALLATGIWINIASFFHMPVSTTHAIIGAVLGFGTVIGGMHAIDWKSIGVIVLSWVTSPVLSGLISYLIFKLLQKQVFYTQNPLKSTKKIAPYLIFLALFFFLFSILFKGTLPVSLTWSLVISFATGAVGAATGHFLLKKIPIQPPSKYTRSLEHSSNLKKAIKNLQKTKITSSGDTYQQTSEILKDLKKLSTKIKKETEYNKTTSQYLKIEKIFSFLQILSACLVAFAHGANDVANAIGPVSAVTQVLKLGVIPNEFSISPFILFLGAFGIVVGLATWGWRVIGTIGSKITELTPTRGFAAEIGTSITILFASKLGLPISTTHALVGSILGVGIARGLK